MAEGLGSSKGLIVILRGLLLLVTIPILAFLLGGLLLLLSVSALLISFARRPAISFDAAKPSPRKVPKRASIVIPNWNGKDLLERCLPSVMRAVAYDGAEHDVIAVDNGSTDGSVEFLRSHYPSLKVIALTENRGFAEACNLGAQRSENEIVIFLNNDMVVEEDFIRPLLDGFTSDDIFAVSAQIYFWDKRKRREETGKTRGSLQWGTLQVWHEAVEEQEISPVLYAGGGSSAFAKDKFLALGGFDRLFQPFYFEDTDLSFRAWRRGWRVLFEPRSVVHHKHRGTISRLYDQKGIHSTMERNHLLFMWRNLTIPSLLPHFSCLWGRLLLHYFKGDTSYLGSFLGALSGWGEVLIRRTKDEPHLLSDSEVLTLSSDLFAYKERFHLTRAINAQERKQILFVSPYIPCLGVHAGAARMYALIKLLAERNDVTLATFVDTDDEFKYVPELEGICQEVIALHRASSLAPRKRNPLTIDPPVLDEFYSPRMEEEIRRLLSKKDFNIVQIEYTQMAQYLVPTRRSCTVLGEYEVAFLAHWRAFRSLPLSWGKVKSLLGWLLMLGWELGACRRFDRVMAVSERDREELLCFDPGLDVFVSPMGVDTSFFLPQEVQEELHSLILVGHFRHTPNVHGLLRFHKEILPRIKAEVPEVHLYVVGSYPPQSVLNLDKDSGITVTGWVPDLRPYLARSSVFVAPLWLGTGMRGKIFEAWAMAKPIVTTSVGAQGINCSLGEDILIADHADEFAHSVITLLRDEGLRRKLGSNGRRRAERGYDWRLITQDLEKVYQEMLAAKFGEETSEA